MPLKMVRWFQKNKTEDFYIELFEEDGGFTLTITRIMKARVIL